MTYNEALDYIHGTLVFGSKPGLERIEILLEKLGNPQDKLKFVHVAGTNGKGSVCAAAAGVLQSAGYRTGLFISPYVLDFCERIQIDGQWIPHEELAKELEYLLPFIKQTEADYEHPTEFEIITALAFDYFMRKGCDVVVLEVGLGGRFDSTNIIKTPLVSIITSISLDHTEILGDTLGKIAFEKSGIIKTGGITVSSPGQAPEALEVIKTACEQRENPLVIPQMDDVDILHEGIEGSLIAYRGSEFFIPLCGRHQIANFITAYEAAALLRGRCGFDITDKAVENGFREVRFPARMEILGESPLVLLDGGHNPDAVQRLAEMLDKYLAGRSITAVMGIFKDKDYNAVIPVIASRAECFIAVRPENPRALEPELLAGVAAAYCRETCWFEDLGEAYASALKRAGAGGVVVICGSFYLAGPMRRIVLSNSKICQKET